MSQRPISYTCFNCWKKFESGTVDLYCSKECEINNNKKLDNQETIIVESSEQENDNGESN